MTAALIPTPVMQFLDADGNPLVGGKVYTYAAGTSTPLATYTDYGGATPNANPVILNSRGEASIWFGTAAYKLELYTAANVLIWTADNVSASTPVVYGTGVAAALAINVGTAGSILVNGGVLGTPSSGLVTNLTGTASININGTVGATTATTGAFTTLSASGTSTMAAINASGTATLSQSGNSELDIAFFRNTSNGSSAGTWVSWGNDAGVASGAIAMSSSTNTTKPSYFDIFNRTASGPLRLGTNNTARLTIDSAGAVTIPGTLGVSTGAAVGGATPGAGGLAFPATAVAVANANTLDDYEEGTFTAAISTASGTVSTSDTTGYYTKIGNQVSVRGYLNVSSVSTPSGEANITGLPFTSGGTYIAASIYLVEIAATAVTSVQAYMSPSGTTITVVIYNAGARIPAGPYFVANAQVMYSATYNV